MKDWEEQLAAREGEMAEWNAGYDKALKKLLKERGLNSFFKEPANADLESAAHDARKTAGNDVPVAMFKFIDLLGEHFMNSGPQERGLIRARVGASNALFPFLWSYVLQSPELITKTSDGPRLRAALAGVCIDDARAEFDALHELLLELYIAAARAGIDASPYFADAAEVASKSASGGGTFLRTILADFDTSIWFNERVKAQPGAEWFRPRAS